MCSCQVQWPLRLPTHGNRSCARTTFAPIFEKVRTSSGGGGGLLTAEEVVNAKENGCLTILQLDANAKIGKENLKNDPNNETANGRILLDVVERQNLTIVNTLDLCKGLTTRERKTNVRVEKSVIDYVIVCEVLKSYLEEMIIDEDRIHVLTKYASRKGIKKTIFSDHNILYSRFSILFDQKPKEIRKELFNFKDKEGQAAFLKETDITELISSSFSSNRSFPHNSNIFFKNLNRCIQKCCRQEWV